MPVTKRLSGNYRQSSQFVPGPSLSASSSSGDLTLGTSRDRSQLDRQTGRLVENLVDKIQAEENSSVKHLITRTSSFVDEDEQEVNIQNTNNSLLSNWLSLTSRSRNSSTNNNLKQESIVGKTDEWVPDEEKNNQNLEVGISRDQKRNKDEDIGNENIFSFGKQFNNVTMSTAEEGKDIKVNDISKEDEDSLQDYEDVISDEEQLEKDLDLLLSPKAPSEKDENESKIASSLYSSFSSFTSPFPSPDRPTFDSERDDKHRNEISTNLTNLIPPRLASSVSTGSENHQRINPMHQKSQFVSSSSSSTPTTRSKENLYRNSEEEERDVENLISTIVPTSVATKRCASADTFSPKSNAKSYSGVLKHPVPQRNLHHNSLGAFGYSQPHSQDKLSDPIHPILTHSTSTQSPPLVRELSFKKSMSSVLANNDSSSNWSLHKISSSNLSSLMNNYDVSSYDNDKEKEKTFSASNNIPNCYDKLNEKMQGFTDHLENLKEQIINSNPGIVNVGTSRKNSSIDNLSEGCLDCMNNTNSTTKSSMYSLSKGAKNKQSYMKDECKCKVKAFNYRRIKINNSLRCLKSISYYLILPLPFLLAIFFLLLPSQPHPPIRSPKSGDLGISGSIMILNSDSRRNMHMHSGITSIPTFGKIPLGFNPYNPSNFDRVHAMLFPGTSDLLSLGKRQYDQDIVEQELPQIQSSVMDEFHTASTSEEEGKSILPHNEDLDNNNRANPTSYKAENTGREIINTDSLVLGKDGSDQTSNLISSNSISPSFSSRTSYHYPNTDEKKYPMLNAVGLYDINKHQQFNERKFTIMINTFKRHDMLKDAITHYGQCSGLVDSIHVTWSEVGTSVPNPTSQEDLDFFSPYIPVIYDQFETTSLNNRFIPPQDLVTDGIFAVDDDIRVSCEDLKLAFHTWQHAEESLVGFMPRIHLSESGMSEEDYKEALKDMKQEELEKNLMKSKSDSIENPILEGNKSELMNVKGSTESENNLERSRLYDPDFESIDTFKYNGWWKVWLEGEYSIILTKAAFLHRKFLYAYTYDQNPAIREYVDKNRNCEDIAMQFLVSDISKKPPVYVRGALSDLGVLSGISTKSWHKLGHMKSRGECLNDFVTLYDGHVPLIKTSMISGSGMSWLFNQPSTIFEYFSSDILHFGKSKSSIKKEQQGEEKDVIKSISLNEYDGERENMDDQKKRKEVMKMNRSKLNQSQLESIHHMLTNLPDSPSAGITLRRGLDGDNTIVYKDGVPLGTGSDFMNMEVTSPATSSRSIPSPYSFFIQMAFLLLSTMYIFFTVVA